MKIMTGLARIKADLRRRMTMLGHVRPNLEL